MDLRFLKKGFLMLLLINAVNVYSQTSDHEEASALQLNSTTKTLLFSGYMGRHQINLNGYGRILHSW